MLENTVAHNIILENRRKILLTGISDVLTFSDDCVVAVSSKGTVTLRGTDMKMGGFNADKGELSAEGNIVAVVYTAEKTQGGLLNRLFR